MEKPCLHFQREITGKWVSGIEKRRRIFHNLASLDEHAQKLCQCAHVVDVCRGCAFKWKCAWVCMFSWGVAIPLRDMNSIREQKHENKWCGNNPFDRKSAPPTWKQSPWKLWHHLSQRGNWGHHSSPCSCQILKKYEALEGERERWSANDRLTMPNISEREEKS